MKKIDEASSLGRDWQAKKNNDWKIHTVEKDRAIRISSGYFNFLHVICGLNFKNNNLLGLDIGSGAGYLASEVASKFNIKMTASEWNEDGVKLINKQNPHLATRLIDIMTFHEKDSWDFILCRELYPFTRVNSYSDQYEVVSRIIDSLKPNGVFLLVGSDVSHPHCMDYKLIRKNFQTDERIKMVTMPYLESIILRIYKYSYFGKLIYILSNKIGEIIFRLMKHRKWAAIRVIAFQKVS